MIIKKLAKDSLYYGGSDFIGKLFTFLSFPVIASALAPEQYGTLELILTISGLVTIFAGCGLNNSVQRFYWESHENERQTQKEIVDTGFVLQASFSILIYFLSYLLLSFLEVEEYTSIDISTVLIALFVSLTNLLISFCLDVFRLKFYIRKFIFVSLAQKALIAVLGVLVVIYIDANIRSLLLTHASSVSVILVLSFFLCFRNFSLSFSREWCKKIFSFGYPFIFASLAYWIFGSIDRWMLAEMLSEEATGIYSAAYRIASITFFASTAFGMAWSPIAIKMKTDHPTTYREVYFYVLLVLIVVMTTVGGGVALFSGEILHLIMSDAYQTASIPIVALSLGIIFNSTQQITAIGISLSRKTRIFAMSSWMTASFNLILNYFLIPIYGIEGAAWSTCVSYFFLTTSYLYFTQKLHPLPVQWYKLITCLGSIILIGITSIEFNQVVLNYRVIGIKIIISISLFVLTLLVLKRNVNFRILEGKI